MAFGGQKEVGCNLLSVGNLTLQTFELDPEGIVVFRGKLMVTDSRACNVHLYRCHDAKLLATSDRLESRPLGICIINATEICVTLLHCTLEIMAINYTGDRDVITVKKRITVNSAFDSCHGVARCMDDIVVCGAKNDTIYWCIVSLNDGRVGRVHRICSGKWIVSQLTTKDSMVFISCNAGYGSPYSGVYAYDIKNYSKETFIYKHSDLNVPAGITLDSHGFLFVCNSETTNYCIHHLHHLRDKCELVTIYREGIPHDLQTIFFDHGILYVACRNSKVINRYEPLYAHQQDPDHQSTLAKYSYEPQVEDEVKLELGDTVEVTKQFDDGWYEGSVNGKTEVFPSNYVEVLEELEQEKEGLRSKEDLNEREGHGLIDIGPHESSHEERVTEKKDIAFELHESLVESGNQQLGPEEFKLKEGQRHWKKRKEHPVLFPHNQRHGQIIELDVREMEALICMDKVIGKGSFGTVYEAKLDDEEIGKYAIKKIEVTDESRRKSYEREICHGRILHPHIIPIIARAEDTSFVYLMYPLMEKRSVRENIEHENEGNLLCKEDKTNSKIWLRCIYQVSQALDYLHKPGKNNTRGPVFHRDLTSRNILFDEDFNVKVCDFGIAVEAKYHANDATATPLKSSTGYHPHNMDPKRYRACYDVHSFSVVILEILTGEVVRTNEPFKKYMKEESILLDAIHYRAQNVKVAKWSNEKLRDHLAKKAWETITSDSTGGKPEVTAADFFKNDRIETSRRYQDPKNHDRCVSCYINPPAKLSLMGEKCKGSETKCTMHCIYCLSDYYNQLVCPKHGPSRPPFGDHVYGVFVAGNHVKDLQGNVSMDGKNEMSLADIASIFINDANKVVNILTSPFPLVLGIRKEHLEVVTPKSPGEEVQIIDDIKEAFKKIITYIRDALKTNGKEPERDRLENSLFIFYFTGHGCKENGLYLGSKNETINDSTEWLKELLHEKLRVDKVLVILDCCHAAQQNFAMKKGESGVGILQVSSCDKNEKSLCNNRDLRGSVFTYFLCQALQGDNFKKVKSGCVTKLCNDCEKDMQEKQWSHRSHCENFHLSCSDLQIVTLSSVKEYIERHYELKGIQMKLKENATDGEEIKLVYYKPENCSISISLRGSQAGEMYSFSSAPESMPSFKQDIIRYIDSMKLQCEIHGVLRFYQKHFKTTAVEKTISLMAIHPVAVKDTTELTSLEDIWKIKTCGRALEAKIRNDLHDLKLNNPVKLNSLKCAMTSHLEEDYKDNGLEIRKDYIQVEVSLKKEVIKTIIQLRQSKPTEQFSEKLKELLDNLRQTLIETDKIEGKVLKFHLYEEFSVLETVL